MKPIIEASAPGRITINSQQFNYDIFIDLEGDVNKRIPYLPNRISSSLELTLEEANNLYDPHANEIIIGSGEKSQLRLSYEATDFFELKKCKIKLLPTQEAINYWNRYEGHALGLFHIAN